MRILLLVFAALCPFGNMSAADKYSMEEGFADANGLLIYYLQVGAGQPLVILHGGLVPLTNTYFHTCSRWLEITGSFSSMNAARGGHRR
jgi:hypothetical protein